MPGWPTEIFRKSEPSQRCPRCDAPIGPDDMNLREGVALCPECGELTRLSQLIDSDRPIGQILDNPPRGCRVEADGRSATVRASTRSIGGFVMTMAFALFWNGITSVFVLIAIAALYSNLVGPLPDWFPAPEMEDGRPVMNDEPMGMGATLFLCVFLTPFVLVGVGMLGAALLNLIGSVVVVIDRHASHASTGVGPLRWRRRFDPNQVESVEVGPTRWQSDDSDNEQIKIVADRTVKIGSSLPAERRRWLRAVLSELLVAGRTERIGDTRLDLGWLDRRG